MFFFQIILLTYGPHQAIAREGDLFGQLLSIWNPSRGADMPRAFMVNAPEREVDLIPDWLKLKMIRSEVSPLVDAALVELDPGKLVLFIQSFGIPVPRWVSYEFYFLTLEQVLPLSLKLHRVLRNNYTPIKYRTRTDNGRSRLVAAPLRRHANPHFLNIFYLTI